MVQSGTHCWDGTVIREVKPESSESDPARFLLSVPEIAAFEYNYPNQGDGKLLPPLDHYLPYNYPLPYDLLRQYCHKLDEQFAGMPADA